MALPSAVPVSLSPGQEASQQGHRAGRAYPISDIISLTRSESRTGQRPRRVCDQQLGESWCHTVDERRRFVRSRGVLPLTMRYENLQHPTPPERARNQLDRHPNYILAAYMASGS
jgi:hypothetical protein